MKVSLGVFATLINLLQWFPTSTDSLLVKMSLVSGRIAVVGANGSTGRKVVKLAIQNRMQVTAMTRTGRFIDENEFAGDAEQDSLLHNLRCDVKDRESLNLALRGANACVFAASASKSGGTAVDIDRNGLINTAHACIVNKVPRLVIVSSGAVTKPFSPVFLFLNLFGGIMRAKFEGENEVRSLYASLEQSDREILGYTIIRPGGLTEEAALGCSGIEINQGDNVSGRISRWDVASLCLNSVSSPQSFNTIFECYNADTGKPLSEVGFSNLFRLKNENDIEPRGFRGTDWLTLFSKLQRDVVE